MGNDFAMKTPPGLLVPEDLAFPVLVQPKLDGLRGICRVDPKGVTWYSYSGKPLWNLEHVSASMPTTFGVYDGEIILPGRPFADAYGLCKRQKPDAKKYPDHEKDKKKLEFHVFDFLRLHEWDSKECFREFRERQPDVSHRIGDDHGPVKYVPTWLAVSVNGFLALHDRFIKQGYEGTMAKDPEGMYHWKRHKAWQRYKPTQTLDVLILEAIEGKGKWKGALGAFIVRMPDGTKCKAGGGRIDLATRKEWWDRRAELIENLTSVEVESKLTTKDGAMREPILIRLREDK